jgi:hypothetical protein
MTRYLILAIAVLLTVGAGIAVADTGGRRPI